MEHRIDIDRQAAGSARLPLEQFTTLRASPAASPVEGSAPAPQAVPAAASWLPAPADTGTDLPPPFNESVVRARIAAATRIQQQHDPAQSGMDLLKSAVAASDELHRIIAELDDLVVGSGPASAEVHRMRIQAQQMLNALRFQHSVSIDGSSLGDILRSDLGTDEADPAAAA